MIDQALFIASWVCLLAGGAFSVIGGIGLIRFPDFYTRMHAAGITDTLGAGLIILGLLFQAGLTLVAVKLIFILFFIFFTSPTSTHAVAHGAWVSGLRPLLGRDLVPGNQNDFDSDASTETVE